MDTIDTRGLSCPEPVLRVQNAIKKNPSLLQVLLDSPTARDNVKAYAEQQGFKTKLSETGGEYTITMER